MSLDPPKMIKLFLFLLSVNRGEGEGYLPPSQGTYPRSRSGWGRGHPKVANPMAKVATPHPGQDGGTPRYLPPVQVRMAGRGGVPQSTYPHPGQDGGGGTPRYLTPPSQGTYPTLWIGQHMEYLIHCGWYASCIYAGGLSCSKISFHKLGQ